MKQHRFTRFVVTFAAALAAVAAGTSAAAAPDATLAAATTRDAERFLTITLHPQAVGSAPRHGTRGRTTLVVRNARAGPESFVLARHDGGLQSLPRFEGMPFVPAGKVVARLHRIRAGGQQRVTVTLASGSYLLVATANASFGMVFADAVRPFNVR